MEEKDILLPEQQAAGEENLLSPESGAESVRKKPHGPGKRWMIPVTFLAVLLCGAALVWLFYANQFVLNIVLEGEQEILVELGERYEEPGVTAVLSGNWILSSGIIPEKANISI